MSPSSKVRSKFLLFITSLFCLLGISLQTAVASRCVDATATDIRSFTLETFNRNIGLMTPEQLLTLSEKRVAIAGIGGLGGEALRGLVGLGIRKFSNADPDVLDKNNRNKQSLASERTEGRLKVEVASEYILERNPYAEIRSFKEGVREENIDRFLEGVDMVIDGIDVFAMGVRRQIFMKAHEKGIPVLTIAPLGRSVSVMLFRPDGITYDRYFDVNEKTNQNEHLLKFILGMAPGFMHRNHYHEQYLRMSEGIAPSYIGSTQIAAGHVVDIVRGVLLGNSEISSAPTSYQYDFSKMQVQKSHLAMGNRGPIQRLKLVVAREKFRRHFIDLPEEKQEP
ncbi:MAG: ThiF family adenylyltransferase [Bdellovibrionales bacterium]|nr:ThiF family adenylyltransferase [Bdellovibrionales bacterium]